MGKNVDLQMKIDGATKTNFYELPERSREKAVKGGGRAGGTVMTRAIRANVPEDSGLLKKSITKKEKYYRATETAVSICGARRDAQGTVRGNVRIPAKYIAIVEGGAKPHGGNPGFVGRHFIEDAERDKGADALEAAQNKMAEVIEREATKLGNE